MSELVKATLPQGLGRGCFLGIAPDGGAWHRLGPLDLDQAQALSIWAGEPAGQAVASLGGRPGWRYLFCQPYATPPPRAGGPAPAEAFRHARQAQARLTGEQVRRWALRQGWWMEIE
jgi:hypothetical protein